MALGFAVPAICILPSAFLPSPAAADRKIADIFGHRSDSARLTFPTSDTDARHHTAPLLPSLLRACAARMQQRTAQTAKLLHFA
jgi:hypothetical protein